MLTRQLLWGPAGGGKTFYGVSSFWDDDNQCLWDEEKPGLWITFGAEDNETLHVPDKYRQRFSSPNVNDLDWLTRFNQLSLSLIAAKKAGKQQVHYVFIDGFSEFDMLYQNVIESVYEEEIRKDNFFGWRKMMGEFFRIVQQLHPNNTGAHLVASARRGEVRKYVQRQSGKMNEGGKKWQVEEEEWFGGAEAAPSLHGGFRRDIPHYFDYVFYLDTGTVLAPLGSPRAGQRIPIHLMQTMRGGDVYVKNLSEKRWLASSHPVELQNATFPSVMRILEELDATK